VLIVLLLLTMFAVAVDLPVNETPFCLVESYQVDVCIENAAAEIAAYIVLDNCFEYVVSDNLMKDDDITKWLDSNSLAEMQGEKRSYQDELYWKCTPLNNYWKQE